MHYIVHYELNSKSYLALAVLNKTVHYIYNFPHIHHWIKSIYISQSYSIFSVAPWMLWHLSSAARLLQYFKHVLTCKLI